MSDIHNLVVQLEEKLTLLSEKLVQLKTENEALNQQLIQVNKDNERLDIELNDWQKKYEALRVANTLLGSDDSRTDTKFKINALIREIDACIIQLSE